MQDILGKGWGATARNEVMKGSVAAGSPLLSFLTTPMWHSCLVLGADSSLWFQSTGHSRFKVLMRLLRFVQVLCACVLIAGECQKVRVLSWSVLGMGERMFDLNLLTIRGQYLRDKIVLYKETYLKKTSIKQPQRSPKPAHPVCALPVSCPSNLLDKVSFISFVHMQNKSFFPPTSAL